MRIADRARAVAAIARSTTVPLERPDRLPRALAAAAPWGASAAASAAMAAARYPHAVAVVDDAGSITYRQLWRRSLAIARGLSDAGAGPGRTVGLLARNSRDFVAAMVAVAATGADLVLLNTGFAAPQLADVVGAEGIEIVVHDDDLAPVVDGRGARAVDEAALSTMAAAGGRVRPPRHVGRTIILTSGTTGRPKGARRATNLGAIEGVAGMLQRIPLRVRDTQVVAAPLFHAWGLGLLMFGMARAATTIVHRRFDPAVTLAAVAHHRADVLVVVPVMLQRIVELGPAVIADYDTRSLRAIASSGSALPAPVVRSTLAAFGPVLYNLYGSTEVAMATLATPADLARSPGTAGRPVLGVRVEVVDPSGVRVPAGSTGRIFVGSRARFEGYTSGGGKQSLRGMLSSGDVGHFDAGGMLHVEGREDDMIVSGGENVFPGEVEDLLGEHPAVAEVAVVGVPDEAFGQALAAFVVRRPGTSLDADEVRAHVRDRLARYKVPRRVEFLDELPRTATGKVLRRALA